MTDANLAFSRRFLEELNDYYTRLLFFDFSFFRASLRITEIGETLQKF